MRNHQYSAMPVLHPLWEMSPDHKVGGQRCHLLIIQQNTGRKMKRFLRIAGVVILGIVVLIQFIPIDRTNPTVTREVAWDSVETRALAQRACFDCHSNETVWPWYSYVAPISLRVAAHVEEGREHLNFSAWDQPNEDFEEIEKVINQGGMPLSDYLLMHAEADLSEAEKQALIEGLRKTLAADPPTERARAGRG
jgi:hypothetical protein